jgi:hypothetical protein
MTQILSWFRDFSFEDCYRTVCRRGLDSLSQGFETGVTGDSPPTVTSMGGSFYLGGLVQGRRPYAIWVQEELRIMDQDNRSPLTDCSQV